MVGQSLGVVSRRSRNHSPIALLFRQGQQFIQSAALLESAGSLQVIQLQINGVAGQLRKSRGNRAGREINGLTNPFKSGLDVGKSDHRWHSTRDSLSGWVS